MKKHPIKPHPMWNPNEPAYADVGDVVDIKYFPLARQLRDRMQQIPRKVAPEIVALVVADPDVRGVTDILDVAIREALEDLAR